MIPAQFTLSMPWPPAGLSQNARGHWGKKHRSAALYRRDCEILALSQGARPISAESLPVRITFRPPSRRLDRDGMVASFKSGIDGIADAIKVNDRRWAMTFVFEEPVRGGAVLIEIGGRS